MLPSPHDLRRYGGALSAAAAELTAVRDELVRDAGLPGWSGPAHAGFGFAAASLAGRLDGLSTGCEDAAARLARAATRVEDELADAAALGRRLLHAAEGAGRLWGSWW